MKKSWFFVAALLFMSVFTSALANDLNRADFCIEHYLATDNVIDITEDVDLSGEPMIINSWLISFSVLTIEFSGELPLVWDIETVNLERLPALGDWIETVEIHESEYGFQAFAVKDADGQVWLVNQFPFDGKFGCMAQPLDQLEK